MTLPFTTYICTYVTVTGTLLMLSELPRGSIVNCIYAMHVCHWAPGVCA